MQVVMLWPLGRVCRPLMLMGATIRERRGPQVNPHNGGAGLFNERGVEYRFERLRRTWTCCPVCGGKRLERPKVEHRRLIPEVEGICGTCGAALMSTPDAKSRVLKPRRH